MTTSHPRLPSPCWAVCCWVAALGRAVGRSDLGEMYLVELVGLTFGGLAVRA